MILNSPSITQYYMESRWNLISEYIWNPVKKCIQYVPIHDDSKTSFITRIQCMCLFRFLAMHNKYLSVIVLESVMTAVLYLLPWLFPENRISSISTGKGRKRVMWKPSIPESASYFIDIQKVCAYFSIWSGQNTWIKWVMRLEHFKLHQIFHMNYSISSHI